MKKNRFFSLLLAAALALSLSVPAMALDDPQPNCSAAILVDGDHGEVLYEQNGYERIYPASITKIMTSLVVLEAIEAGELSLDDQITASQQAVTLPEGSSNANPPIQAGEILTVEQLLYCDLLPSANEACNILAEAVAGSTEAFVERMNAKAQELGMENTHFTNPHGLHDPDHYTTAYEIYVMAQAAMEHELFRTIVSTPTYTIPATNMNEERVLHQRLDQQLVRHWQYILQGHRHQDRQHRRGGPMCGRRRGGRGGAHLLLRHPGLRGGRHGAGQPLCRGLTPAGMGL